MRGAPNRGPGRYNNAEVLLNGLLKHLLFNTLSSFTQVSSFTYNLDKWKCSKRGYSCGARSEQRFRKVRLVLYELLN